MICIIAGSTFRRELSFMKSILVLTDFSAAAKYAAERALVIAAQFHTEIWLANVYPITPYLPPVGAAPLPEISAAQKRQKSMGALNREVRRLERIKRLIFHPIALEGQVAESAARLARRKKSLLIVMGLSDKSYGDMLFSGEVKAVLQQAYCPVLAVPLNWPGPEIRHILFATDLAATDEQVIGELVDFATRLKAVLTIGHISPPVVIPDFAEETHTATFCEKIKSLYPAIRFINPRASNVIEAIEQINADKQVDVIALRYRKHPFWYHLFNENPLKELIIQGNKPLLIFPESSNPHEQL